MMRAGIARTTSPDMGNAKNNTIISIAERGKTTIAVFAREAQCLTVGGKIMKIKDLAYKCRDRGIECCGCPYEDICSELNERLEDISPCGLLTILEEEIA